MKIAVLVPVYNAERYLSECLDSLLATGVEIFCLNDGSTDGTQKLLVGYAARHPRVHVACQDNCGVAVARNRLLALLPPDYEAFAFCDADDTVAPDMYATLAEALERTGADVAESEYDGEGERTVDDLSVYLLRATALGAWINIWNKLYRRSTCGAFRFREGLSFEEDFFYNYEVNAAIRRKVLLPKRFYGYRENPESVTSRLNHRRYFESTSLRIRLSLSEFLAKGRIPPALEPAFRSELAKDAYRMVIRKNLKKNRDVEERRELFFAAGEFFSGIEREFGFTPCGLNPVQRFIYSACRRGRYRLASLLVLLT